MLRPLLAALLLALAVRPASAYTPAEGAAPMTVTLVKDDGGCGTDCSEWLALTGKIGPETPALFSSALARLGPRRVPVLVDSPGGSVDAAMAIGNALRLRGMGVAVAATDLRDCAASDRACTARRRAGGRLGVVSSATATCASACVLILAAGAERWVGPGSRVGVHQMTVRRTLTRVLNHFRIVRRMVDGRPVEISRTLVGTEPISSRTLMTAAPEALYSEVDRYLLRFGIAEAVVTLMRSAPPSGVHWMTAPELFATHLATDAGSARGLLAHAASAKPPSPPTAPSAAPDAASGTMGLAAAVLGDGRRVGGIVTWRIEGRGERAALTGAFDVPERGLRGGLAFARDDKLGLGGGFLASTDVLRPAAALGGRGWTAGAPLVCDASVCDGPFFETVESDDGQGHREFRAVEARRGILLSSLKDRDRVMIPLSTVDGARGWVSLAIDRDVRAIVDEWERACCGVAPATPSGPLAAAADASWTVLPGAAAPQPGAVALLGSVDVPSVGLHLSIEAGPAPRGATGAVALSLHPSPEVARFGMVSEVNVEPITAADGRTLLVGTAGRRVGGTFRIELAPAGRLPPGTKLTLAMTDAGGRRLSVPIALPDALIELLAAAPGA